MSVFFHVPDRRAGSRRPIGHLANIGRESSLDERDAPEGGDFVSPSFEDGRLGGRDLYRSRVVDSHLLLVENRKISCVAHFAGARERVEGDVRHHVECSRWLAELMLHGPSLGGVDLLSCRRAEDLGGCIARELEAAGKFADVIDLRSRTLIAPIVYTMLQVD